MDLQVESHLFNLTPKQQLHLQRFYTTPDADVIFMLHGAIENGKIFYSNSGKGLAPFLAKQGYDVFVADLRGKGKSKPLIDKHATYGQTEAITEEIPAFIEAIKIISGNYPSFWIAHSWGGVLLNSALARYPKLMQPIKAMVHFSVKRCVRVHNWRRFIMVDIIWKYLAKWIAALFGYLPAKQLKIGSDNESKKYHLQTLAWVRPKAWRDPQDQFDYAAAVKQHPLPPALYLTGCRDFALGHANDVTDFMQESNHQHSEFLLLSQANSNLHDYDHISILTHPDAERDQFQRVLDWLVSYKTKVANGS
ncbi:MAG: alpha/beta fold hydrolase [Pseudomonadota bacterium]